MTNAATMSALATFQGTVGASRESRGIARRLFVDERPDLFRDFEVELGESALAMG
jgi:hypothetical protein